MKANRFSILGVALLSAVVLLSSCKKDRVEESHEPPTLTSAAILTARGVDVNSVGFGEWIVLKGTHLSTTFKVDFNGVLAKDSLFYADDTTVTVKIPTSLPDPINNPITVTTKYGSATLNFKILQPAPVITGFDPAAGNPDDIVTITGDYFNGVTDVKFETTSATIVSKTQTEIKVKVPAGVTYGYIYVTTPVGTAVSATAFGFKSLIYDDAMQNGWTNTSYSSTYDMNFTGIVRRGAKAIKHNFTVGFGACRFSHSPAYNASGMSAVKISIYGGPGTEGKKVRITIVSGTTVTILLTEGRWTEYQIPLNQLGSPATIASITFQEFSGLASTIYIDDVGFI